MSRKYTPRFIEIKNEWFKERSEFHNKCEKIVDEMRKTGCSQKEIYKFRQSLIPHYSAIKEKYGIIITNNEILHEYIDMYEDEK